ncbi:MAG: hypothetical protein MJ250_01615 [Alphaproteobacteria bacterium]|nr:hypothetical protein [Alphaproteobacteria bacterium]
MGKENKLISEQEIKNKENVELNDEELAIITVGSEIKVLKENEKGWAKKQFKDLLQYVLRGN